MMKKLFFVILVLSCTVLAQTDFKIFTLKHHFASDLLPSISQMVGEDGVATGTNNQLIVRAAPERMREIEQLISQLDTEKINRKISVKTSNNLQTQNQRAEASGTAKVGKVTVNNDKHAQKSSKSNSGSIEVENASSSTNESSNQFINVLDGERAFIRVGKIVPFTEEWITMTRRYAQIERFTDWREISTGFAVRPRAVGHQIELEITPRIAKLNNQGYIDFEELTTTLRVSLGSWVDLGGTMQNNDDISRKILGALHTSSLQNSSLMVKVD
ncbi:MAG: secretin N-terminal domain-containing protein [Methylophilaceae bacterium]